MKVPTKKPGFLGLSTLTARLKPVQGHVARILLMIGAAGFASIITGEMLASRLVLDGVGNAAPISLWTNLFMGPVVAAVGPALLAMKSSTHVEQEMRGVPPRCVVDHDGNLLRGQHPLFWMQEIAEAHQKRARRPD
jgi:hypothetical protein